MSDSLWPYGLQHTGLPCPSLSSEICSDSCPLIWWCNLNISSSATPFFFVILSNLCLIYTWSRVEIFIFNNLLKQVLTPSFPNRDLYGKVSGLYKIYMSDNTCPLCAHSVSSHELIHPPSHLIITTFPQGGPTSKTWENLSNYGGLDFSFTKGNKGLQNSILTLIYCDFVFKFLQSAS